MYHCIDCDRDFDEPKEYEERHGLDTPPYEKFNGCPYCGGAYETIKEEDEDYEC